MGKRSYFLASSEECFPNNVLSLDEFRRSRWLTKSVDVLYVGDGEIPDPSRQVLERCTHGLKLVSDSETLLNTLGTFLPALILIESGIKWMDPVALVESLSSLTSSPLVMLCTRDTRKADRPQLLKRAFAAGLHDNLLLPLKLDEVEETFGVLLKYRAAARP